MKWQFLFFFFLIALSSVTAPIQTGVRFFFGWHLAMYEIANTRHCARCDALMIYMGVRYRFDLIRGKCTGKKSSIVQLLDIR